jgi:hypothetical protein
MTDIVERLRDHASAFRGTEILTEAADEIERLRAALSGILKAWDEEIDDDVFNAIEAARSALKEQP